MKILIISKDDIKGGASIAGFRLFKALEKHHNDLKINFLVQTKHSDQEAVIPTNSKSWRNKLRFIWERLVFLLYERSSEVRFKFSIANTGEDITQSKLFNEADVIHIHWFNQGFLSLRTFRKILDSGKPVVWTLHDMWAFTGGCHYAGNCSNYQDECGNCPFLKKPSNKDLSTKIYNRKKKIYSKNKNLTFITCSNWMKSKANESSLVKDFNIHHIPNTIDTDFFKHQDILNSTKHFNLSVNKKFILFGAANISDQRKGLSYLLDALQLIPEEASDSIELLVFGKIKDDILTNIPFKVNHLSYLNSKKDIVNLYNVANCFVLPSLEDNLPNTIMESLACGTPVVGFNTGGIPEMIEHKKTGYLAEYKSAKDLADGIYWTLFEANTEVLAENSRQKVLSDFNQEKIAGLHKELYEKVLENSKHAE